MRFKVLGITAEQISFIALEDRLDTEGCIAAIMRSPPAGMEGRQWLGITVPEKSARFRVEMVSFKLAGYPTSRHHVDFVFQCESFDLVKTGLSRAVIMFWQILSTRIMPMVIKMQARFAGSSLDRFYNADEENSCRIRLALMEIHSHILRFLAEKSGEC